MSKTPLISQTKIDIEHAASEAVRVIAKAAEEAAKVVANAAAESVKVVNVKTGDDHDLLIELKTRMEGLKTDIEGLKNGTSTQIADHETRINSLESSKTKQNAMMSIGIGLLSILVSIMIYHIAK